MTAAAPLGVAGAVGDDDPARREGQDPLRAGVGRDADDGDAAPDEGPDDIRFDAAVDEDDRLRGLGVVDADLRRRDLGDEVAGVRIGDLSRFAAQPGGALRPVSGVDEPGHDAVDPEPLGQGPGVDAGDPGDAVLAEPVVDGLPRRGVRRPVAELGDDVARDLRPVRLEAGRVDAVVADQRVGLDRGSGRGRKGR